MGIRVAFYDGGQGGELVLAEEDWVLLKSWGTKQAKILWPSPAERKKQKRAWKHFCQVQKAADEYIARCNRDIEAKNRERIGRNEKPNTNAQGSRRIHRQDQVPEDPEDAPADLRSLAATRT
jgi:hypothetical protein